MQGFFSSAKTKSDIPVGTTAFCGRCQLHKQKGLKHPKMKVAGKGRRRILIVGDAPDSVEDIKGVPFKEPAGKYFDDEILSDHGIDLYKDCWVTTAVRCFPKSSKGKYREPTSAEIECCRPHLLQTIRKLKPIAILAMGIKSVGSLVPLIWKSSGGNVSRWRGWCIPSHTFNTWVSFSIHPLAAKIAREKKQQGLYEIFLHNEIKEVLKKQDRPYTKIPNYRKDVKLVYDTSDICQLIQKTIKVGRPTAWDIETNCLKPETPGADIYSCSLSQLKGPTFAFPTTSPVVRKALVKFLRSPVKKIASNLKFEDRWSRSILQTPVRAWWWDTMLAAHVINGNRGACSIKFLSFVYLGVPIYNKSVDDLLRATGENGLNRIMDIPMEDLLVYNGLDSLLERDVSMLQRAQFRKA